MSWLGDVGSFEGFNLKGMLNQIGENPERMLYGSADPFSTNVWNGILGTDHKPIIDQWGGAAKHRYAEAEKAGINTGPGAQMHGVARTIAGMFAGNAAGNALGGAGSGGTGLLAEQAAAPVSNATFSAGSGGLTTGLGAQVPAQGGLLGAYNTAKPYMDAAKTGMDVANQFKKEEVPIIPSPITPNAGNNMAMTGLLAQMKDQTDARRMEEQQRRMQRRRQIGGY